ncbi:MAG TPA: FlgD immunoglobulin-like domain containing protein, partial [Bacteroidota bacterium]|nr:FlgD immunoglobulin-like domain containing protein [Bacteroidota bacterium]
TITNPAPTLSAMAPASAFKGQTLDVIFTGTNYISATTVVNFDTNAATVNSIGVSGDALLMDANITIKPTALAGTYNVTLSNPAPGGGTSAVKVFTVNNPPLPPVLISPANGAKNLYTRQQFRWSKPASSTKYWMELSISPAFNGTLVSDSTLTDTTRFVTGLLNDTLWYWHVKAFYPAAGWGPFSAPDTFRTGALYPKKFALLDTIYFPTRVNAGDFQTTDYQIVGLPGASNLSVATVVGGTLDKDWTAYWDNGNSANYMIKYDGSATFQFSPGRSFWILRRGSLVIKDSVPSIPIDTNGIVKIPLHAGWNLITNPFPAAVAWSYVQSLNGGVTDSIWQYNAGPSTSSLLSPYTGYYFPNTRSLDSLKVPFSGLSSSAPPPLAKASAPDGWRISVAVRTDRSQDQGVALGVSGGATRGLNAMNYRKPRMFSALPLAFFNRPEWDPKYASFGADIRPDVSTLEKWSFEVDYTGRKPYELSFSGVENVPGAFDVFLIDENGARSADMRQVHSWPFTPATDVSRFTVIVGTPDAVKKELASVLPKEFALGANYPNPFNPTTTIPVAVPAASRVSLRVYNILGEEVRTLFDGPLEGGRYAFTWDGRNGGGNPVATGVYIVRLTSDAGKHLTGKMLLLK